MASLNGVGAPAVP
jgi:hypothetical protein